jgi:hypothetical protein
MNKKAIPGAPKEINSVRDVAGEAAAFNKPNKEGCNIHQPADSCRSTKAKLCNYLIYFPFKSFRFARQLKLNVMPPGLLQMKIIPSMPDKSW